MKIKSNYLNAFHVANLSLSLSPLHCYVFVKFFSLFFFFFILFFSHFIFSVLFIYRRCATTSHFSWPLLPFAKSREYVFYIYIYIWRLKEDYNLFSVNCSVFDIGICVSNRKFSFAINKLLKKLRIIREKFYFNLTLRSFLLKNT